MRPACPISSTSRESQVQQRVVRATMQPAASAQIRRRLSDGLLVGLDGEGPTPSAESQPRASGRTALDVGRRPDDGGFQHDAAQAGSRGTGSPAAA